MRVLLIAINFPPLNKVGSRRVVSFANYLSEFGCDVIVVTNKKTSIDGKTDYRPFIDKKIRVIETNFLSQIAEKEGADDPQLDQVQKDGKSEILRKVNRWLRWNVLGAMFHPYDYWFLTSRKNPEVDLAAQNSDVMITSFGPAAPVYMGRYFKNKYPHLKWIVDYRDLWSTIPTEKLLPPFSLLQSFVERRTVQCADGIITVSQGLGKSLKDLFPNKPIEVVYNGFEGEIAEKQREGSVYDLTIRYVGTLYPKTRDPIPFLDAVNNLEASLRERVRIEFFGAGYEYYQDEIATITKDIQFEHFGMVDATTATNKVMTADLLYFVEQSAGKHDGTLTAKVFEYLQSARPILAVGITENSELGLVLSRSGLATLCPNKSDKITEALADMETLSDRNANRGYISSFSRKNQAKVLFQFLREVKSMKRFRGVGSEPVL